MNHRSTVAADIVISSTTRNNWWIQPYVCVGNIFAFKKPIPISI